MQIVAPKKIEVVEDGQGSHIPGRVDLNVG
jgi:hypothetical protein